MSLIRSAVRHPDAYRRSPLHPILVHVRMTNAQVLGALLKKLGSRRDSKRVSNLVLNMERLNNFNEDDVSG